MAVNQEAMTRQISLPAQSVAAGSGLTQLAGATSAVAQLLSERVNDVAIEQAALQGEADVQANKQPDNLTLPFTRATKAYNNAVANTEARRMIQSADELINEVLVTHKDPSKFTRESPAQFSSALEGIKSGILQNARGENREHIREALDRMSAQASINMLQHSIAYDNQKMKFDMQHDVNGLMEAAKNAAIAGDTERLNGIYAAIDATVGDY